MVYEVLKIGEENTLSHDYYKNFDTFMNKAILDYLPERGES